MGAGDILALMTKTIGLCGRLAALVPYVYLQRRRAMRALEEELRRSGLPPGAAADLAHRWGAWAWPPLNGGRRAAPKPAPPGTGAVRRDAASSL
jgi:hypothetical protein